MSVVSASTSKADDALSMASEVQHCHAALLYGDQVTLISPRSAVLKEVANTGSFTGTNLIRFAAEVAPYLFRDKADILELAKQLVEYPRELLVTPAQRDQHASVINGMLAAIAPNQDELVQKARAIISKSGFDQLQEAVDRKILTIDDVAGAEISMFVTKRTDPVMTGLISKIQEVLMSGNQYPLFDSHVSSIVRTGLQEGILTRVPMSRRHGSDAAMASGLFDYLPNFPHANTSEILDIRDDLDAPLKAFRIGIRNLSKEISTDPESAEFGSEIEDSWNLQVRPALDEIDALIRDNSSLSNLLGRTVRESASLPGLTAAVTLGASLGVAAGPMTSVPLAAGAAVGMSVAAVRAYLSQGEALEEVAGTQFYFLYGANQRISVAS